MAGVLIAIKGGDYTLTTGKCLLKEYAKMYIYTMEHYAAERKKGFLSFAIDWMELESIMLSEISQSVKDKYNMISLIREI